MPKRASKLDPLAPVIFDLQGKGMSYAAIAQRLNDDYGVKVSTTAVFDFVKGRAASTPGVGKENATDREPANQDVPHAPDPGQLAVQLREDIVQFHETTLSFHQALTEALERHLSETDRQVATALASFERTAQDMSDSLNGKIDALAAQIEARPPSRNDSPDGNLNQAAVYAYVHSQLGRVWRRAFLISFGVCGIIFGGLLIFILLRGYGLP